MPSLLSKDFYELFRLPVSYEIDASLLQQRYQELQRNLHPDRYVTAADQQRRLSVQLAAHINEAFQTLKNPLSRARYMLQRQGIDTDQAAAAMDPGFLAEQIELRESLAELSAQHDPGAAIQQLRAELDRRVDVMQHDFSELIGQRETLEQAHGLFDKLQFIYRLQQELDALEEQLFV